MINFIFNHFDYPWILLLIPFIISLLVYFTFKDFTSFKDQDPTKRKKLRIFVLVTRIFIFILLLTALAYPFKEITKTVEGSPRVKILVDNSSSMQLFPYGLSEELKTQLEEQIPVEIFEIGNKDHSALGDEILSHIKQDDNLLLITDGHAHEGTNFGDAALYAAGINVTINAIKLQADKHDTAVRIIGPDKVTAHSENTYTVKISKTQQVPVTLTVTLDGTILYQERTNAEELQFKQTFSDGYHELRASITEQDYFRQNNEFFKMVKVVPKPKVLLITQQDTPLEILFNPVYDLTISSTILENLDPYTALILNDLPASILDQHIDALIDYTIEGNGLFVIGGENSYDLGGYKGSRIEQILPVHVAQAGKKKGDISLVVVIDISGSTGSNFGSDKAVDVEKSLALGVLQDLSLIHRVGVVAFNTKAYIIGEMKPLLEHAELEDNIARLQDGGGTHMHVGILKALELLQNQRGSKNIIFITDGKTQSADEAEDAVKLASSQGVRIYFIGVGQGTNEGLLKHYADISNGAYYEPEARETIKILFGDAETSGDRRIMPYVFVDENHFIGQGLEPKGNIYGFNVVAPKNSAKLIATTDTGDTLLAVNRFGLGRIASLATDDGDLYAPELLNQDNSRIFTRTANWVIGDPERNNQKFIQIEDGRVNEPLEVLIKDAQEPTLAGLDFIKIDENLWTSTLAQEEPGSYRFGEATYAINYPAEYQEVGQSTELEKIVTNTQGKMFNPDEILPIIEHVRARSKRYMLQKAPYAWILGLIALIIFLGEICLRRVIRNFYK